VDNALVFKGPCDSVKPYVSRALAYLMCSEFEGLGRVTVEAMFYGCPVIARKSGGTLEVVRDRENGFFFDTVGECAALMREMSENTPMDVVSRAQEDAVARFSEEAFGKKLLEIYDSVLDGRGTPGETGTIVKDRVAAF
jgi:glycosyltransferase involved in cell wall biosynthesis